MPAKRKPRKGFLAVREIDILTDDERRARHVALNVAETDHVVDAPAGPPADLGDSRRLASSTSSCSASTTADLGVQLLRLVVKLFVAGLTFL